MEFRIIDLFDTVEDSRVCIPSRNVASVSRIKELTMKKVNREEPKQQTRRSVGVFILVAAVIVIMAGTAVAATFRASDWFDGLFGDISEEQRQVVDEMNLLPPSAETANDEPQMPAQTKTEFAQQVCVANGNKVTLLAAIGDRSICYAKLHIEAPEGTVLNIPDEEVGYLQLFDGETGHLTLSAEDYEFSGFINFEWEDPVPDDNMLEVTILFTGQYGARMYFNDGVSKTMTIKGLYLQSPASEYTQILEGPWSFDLGSCPGDLVHLDVEGLCTNFGSMCQARLTQMRLSQLGLEIESDLIYAAEDPGDAYVPINPYIVLKDGSRLATQESHGDDGYFERFAAHYRLEEPIDIKQVDYVEYGQLQIPVEGNTIELPDNGNVQIPYEAKVPQATSADGTVVSARYFLADDYYMHAAIQIAAPADVDFVIPEETEGKLVISDGRPLEDLLGAEGVTYQIAWEDEWFDERPTDNQLRLIIGICAPVGGENQLNDGKDKTLTIPGVWLETPDGEYIPVLEGPWSFTFNEDTQYTY